MNTTASTTRHTARHGVCWAALAAVLCCGLALPARAQGVGATEEAAVRAELMKTWDRPESRLSADPVVTHGTFALAGWAQGDRGGRALLRKTAQGWQVHVCGGDGIKDVAALSDAGVDAGVAKHLIEALTAAEAKLPAEQVRKFSLFGKNVAVGQGHAAHGSGSSAHGASGSAMGHAAPAH